MSATIYFSYSYPDEFCDDYGIIKEICQKLYLGLDSKTKKITSVIALSKMCYTEAEVNISNDELKNYDYDTMYAIYQYLSETLTPKQMLFTLKLKNVEPEEFKWLMKYHWSNTYIDSDSDGNI